MLLVDAHCHLDHHKYAPVLDEVINRARQAGVKAIITQGVSHERNIEVLKLAEKYPDIVKAALGLYPLDAPNVECLQEFYDEYSRRTSFDVDSTLEFIKKNKERVTAIGEVGIDYKYSQDKVHQRENFQKIIDLAEKIKKPLIVHSRKAEFDVVEMLESSRAKKVVLHVFEGRKHLIKKAADLGFMFSIPTLILKLQHFQLMAETVSLSQLLTETDGPWLSPYPDKINEPAYVAETVKKIAEIKGLDAEEVSNNIYANYQRMFE